MALLTRHYDTRDARPIDFFLVNIVICSAQPTRDQVAIVIVLRESIQTTTASLARRTSTAARDPAPTIRSRRSCLSRAVVHVFCRVPSPAVLFVCFRFYSLIILLILCVMTITLLFHYQLSLTIATKRRHQSCSVKHDDEITSNIDFLNRIKTSPLLLVLVLAVCAKTSLAS